MAAAPGSGRVPAGLAVARAVGCRLLDLPVRPRMPHWRSADRRPLGRSPRVNGPLTLEEAQRVVDGRIASRPTPTLVLPEAAETAAALRGAVAD